MKSSEKKHLQLGYSRVYRRLIPTHPSVNTKLIHSRLKKVQYISNNDNRNHKKTALVSSQDYIYIRTLFGVVISYCHIWYYYLTGKFRDPCWLPRINLSLR